MSTSEGTRNIETNSTPSETSSPSLENSQIIDTNISVAVSTGIKLKLKFSAINGDSGRKVSLSDEFIKDLEGRLF